MLDDMSPLVFTFYKIAKMLVFPLTWVWLLLVLAVIFLFLSPTPRRLKTAKVAATSALGFLYLLSIGPIGAYLAGFLEQAYPPFQRAPGHAFDAIVILTGDLIPKRGARPVTELTHTTLHRTLCGADAYAEGLSAKLLLSGGAIAEGEPIDATEMKNLATRVGVPEAAILQEDRSRNTYESAKEVRRMLGEHVSILLVTSAIHIPRAMALFKKQGFDATAYPCGYLSQQEIYGRPRVTIASLIPSVEGLSRSTAAINELAGLAVYRVAGKL